MCEVLSVITSFLQANGRHGHRGLAARDHAEKEKRPDPGSAVILPQDLVVDRVEETANRNGHARRKSAKVCI